MLPDVWPEFGNALGRRHTPRTGAPVSYRPCLRLEFDFTCVYCRTREAEISNLLPYGGFEVEHFKPAHRFKRFRRWYSNLVWACRKCNEAKGGRWPSAQEEVLGYRLVDPIRERAGDHLRLVGERVEVVSGSRAGEYTIDTLRLNGEYQVDVRRARATKLSVRAQMVAKIAQLDQMTTANKGAHEQAMIRKQMDEMLALVDQLLPSKPHDPPPACRCR